MASVRTPAILIAIIAGVFSVFTRAPHGHFLFNSEEGCHFEDQILANRFCALVDDHLVILSDSRGAVQAFDSEARLLWSREVLPHTPLATDGEAYFALLPDGKGVVSLARDGRELWVWKSDQVFDAIVARAGQVLAASYATREVWPVRETSSRKLDQLAPIGSASAYFQRGPWNSVQLLPDGKLLVFQSEQAYSYNTWRFSAVEELNLEGEVVWRYLGNPATAFHFPNGVAARVENGNTVITAGAEILEVDRDSRLVRKWQGRERVLSIQPLSDSQLEMLEKVWQKL